jgi:hypothetical protein
MGTVDLIAELRRDIWGPFVESYAKRDADAFAGLHAPDLIRAEGAGGWAGGLDAYLDRVRPFFDDMTAKGAEVSIGFRFGERIIAGDVASERGVYRSRSASCTAVSTPSPARPTDAGGSPSTTTATTRPKPTTRPPPRRRRRDRRSASDRRGRRPTMRSPARD